MHVGDAGKIVGDRYLRKTLVDIVKLFLLSGIFKLLVEDAYTYHDYRDPDGKKVYLRCICGGFTVIYDDIE